MALDLWEKFGSRERTEAIKRGSSARLLYGASGSADDDEILAYAVPRIPALVYGLVRQGVDLEQQGPDLWELAARYAPASKEDAEDRDIGEIRFSFDTGGGSFHVTHNRFANTQRFGPQGADPKDFEGGIGVNDDTVDGVDIIIPQLRLTLDFRAPSHMITMPYVLTLSDLTGTVNDGTFFGFPKGDLLFLGSSGDQSTQVTDKSSSGGSSITFTFLVSETEKDLKIGEIVVPTKLGHEYLWVSYSKKEKAGAVLQAPVGAYVEQVYPFGDFSKLGIGTTLA